MIAAWWVVRDKLTSREGIARLVEDAAAHGIKELIAQVRGRGDAYYAHGVEPRAEGLAAEFDPLGTLIERAHAADIHVHAWVNVFFVWSHPDGRLPLDRRHIVHAHPEWLIALDPRGGSDFEGIYADARHEGVRDHTLRVCRDIVGRYAVEGLHFDFVRYPQVTYAPSPEAHVFVTDFVERCVESVRPRGVTISAAVFPDPEVARERVLQRWTGWPIDVACPMAYRQTSAEVERLARSARAAWSKRLWIGLMGYAGQPELLRAQVAGARDAGADGVVLFRYESEWRDLMEAFAEAAAA